MEGYLNPWLAIISFLVAIYGPQHNMNTVLASAPRPPRDEVEMSQVDE